MVAMIDTREIMITKWYVFFGHCEIIGYFCSYVMKWKSCFLKKDLSVDKLSYQ